MPPLDTLAKAFATQGDSSESLLLQDQRDRAVVDPIHVHHGTKDAGLHVGDVLGEPCGEVLVKHLALLGACGVDETGTVNKI